MHGIQTVIMLSTRATDGRPQSTKENNDTILYGKKRTRSTQSYQDERNKTNTTNNDQKKIAGLIKY